MNTVQQLNNAIHDFVRRPENAVLRPGTGAYSTPFRGSLFGCDLAQDVESKLADQKVSVLFLGSNPNCPASLEQILDPVAGLGDWPEFEAQLASGCFGESSVGQFGPRIGWDPLHNPSSMGPGQAGSWLFYAEAIRSAVGSLDGVAMANVFPWGSAELDDLIKALKGNALNRADPSLLDRVVGFANQQLEVIIKAFRPRLVLCPLSIFSHSALAGLLLSRPRLKDLADRSPEGLAKAFTLQLATASIAGLDQRLLFLKHPSALRWHRASERPAIADALASAIGSIVRQAG